MVKELTAGMIQEIMDSEEVMELPPELMQAQATERLR
jgi:hypothetical protein